MPLVNVNLPVGKWIVSAKGQISVGSLGVRCELVNLDDGQVFDVWQVLGGANDMTVSLFAAVSLPADSTIWLRCDSGTQLLTLRYPKISAFQASVIATP